MRIKWEGGLSIFKDTIISQFSLFRYKHASLDFYSACSLKQQFANRHVAPFVHINYPDSEPTSALLNATCLVEKQQQILIFSVIETDTATSGPV